MRSLLCPVDFSANSRAALRYAASLARMTDGRLLVLYVDDPLLAAVAATRANARAILTADETDLKRFVSRTLGNSTPPVETTLLTLTGNPAREIVRTAREAKCDVIVLGYRGVNRASRLLFGSTTEGVLRKTTVPVVAIPPAFRSRSTTRRRRALKRAS